MTSRPLPTRGMFPYGTGRCWRKTRVWITGMAPFLSTSHPAQANGQPRPAIGTPRSLGGRASRSHIARGYIRIENKDKKMPRMHITAYTLLTVGTLFLVGLTGLSTVAAEKDSAPILQPSPRPTSALPTLRPTSWLPTLEPTPTTIAPTAIPPTSKPPKTSTQVPLPTPTSTPTPPLLPNAGGAFHGGWPLGLGICLTLLGLVRLFIRRQHA